MKLHFNEGWGVPLCAVSQLMARTMNNEKTTCKNCIRLMAKKGYLKPGCEWVGGAYFTHHTKDGVFRVAGRGMNLEKVRRKAQALAQKIDLETRVPSLRGWHTLADCGVRWAVRQEPA